MYAGNKAVRHIFDVATNFILASFLPDVNTSPRWGTFVKFSSSIHTELQSRIPVDWWLCSGDNGLALQKLLASTLDDLVSKLIQVLKMVSDTASLQETFFGRQIVNGISRSRYKHFSNVSKSDERYPWTRVHCEFFTCVSYLPVYSCIWRVQESKFQSSGPCKTRKRHLLRNGQNK